VMLTASNSPLKQSCSAFTSATSALEVNFNVMRSVHLRFTLLYFALHAVSNIVAISGRLTTVDVTYFMQHVRCKHA